MADLWIENERFQIKGVPVSFISNKILDPEPYSPGRIGSGLQTREDLNFFAQIVTLGAQ